MRNHEKLIDLNNRVALKSLLPWTDPKPAARNRYSEKVYLRKANEEAILNVSEIPFTHPPPTLFEKGLRGPTHLILKQKCVNQNFLNFALCTGNRAGFRCGLSPKAIVLLWGHQGITN